MESCPDITTTGNNRSETGSVKAVEAFKADYDPNGSGEWERRIVEGAERECTARRAQNLGQKRP
jgi:hypothetical protein